MYVYVNKMKVKNAYVTVTVTVFLVNQQRNASLTATGKIEAK
jgi:hypothetical protein